MTDDFPGYQDLDITDYPLIAGFYTLGMIEKHRPDITIVHYEQWTSADHYDRYDWLDQIIRQKLEQGKIVSIFIWDENISFNKNFIDCIKKYQNRSVYLITQLDDFSALIYKDHGITNILEIPWWLLNDCLVYYRLCDRNNIIEEFSDHNFLCMIGRPEEHKYLLAKELQNRLLDGYGLITSLEDKQNFKKSKFPPYPKLNHPLGKTRANKNINGIWASANVENFLCIEKTYKSIPLIVNVETSIGCFFTTEKSIWPLLLGRLCLIGGRHRIMTDLQRFFDVKFRDYMNMDFDQKYHGVDMPTFQKRISQMIDDNQKLFIGTKSIYQKFSADLENARWTLGENFYNFFVAQIKKIIAI